MTSASDERRRTAVHAAVMFDGTDPVTIDDPVVLIEDGRIVAVTQGLASVPPDAMLLDLPGTTLIPGLVDPHVHLALDASADPVSALASRDDDEVVEAITSAGRAQLSAGVTTVRDLGDRGYLSLGLPPRPALPTVVSAGPPITIAGGHCHFLGGVAHGVDGVRAAVREHADRGVAVIKVIASGGTLTAGSDPRTDQFTPDELAALVDEAHRHGLPVTAHAHATTAIEAAVAAGVDGLEHCTFLTDDGVAAPDELLAEIVARRIAVSATLGLVPGPERARKTPEILKRNLAATFAIHRRLIADGAVYAVGTDAGISPEKPHGVLVQGLIALGMLGVTPAEALRRGTSVAAHICGLGDRKGRIAPGFDADLVAIDGDPLVDRASLRRPLAVLVAGRAIDRTV
ncbi:amidohydrolase family protein [Tsukamurella sp. 8F]|uniref:amidohydrolase family protein n=1 Tax=unclassified Tsukamurella TaxID=2633480 RepID=UPI0023BA0676|nr:MULTISPECIES: amidohydrolase family protein [unclassified Tsukamurella]MDF0531168.1 amidohydrolase family protein [Tsukamurella sp. 8J]MDF0585885.1 amidohydrolase family protein [Tsukamurella sp. 8F]